jgi:eukaryotic-like serine/threonine-protein kinase
VATLARALHHAHQHGIVHRNLKPSVILLTAAGLPKIGSFDLARLLRQDPDPAEAEGQLVGTLDYMAPEQAAGDLGAIGPATDVHGLGLLLYEMLTGQAPFGGETPQEILQQVRERVPAPVRRLRAEAPEALERICARCLEKDPARRYPSALALAEAMGDGH